LLIATAAVLLAAGCGGDDAGAEGAELDTTVEAADVPADVKVADVKVTADAGPKPECKAAQDCPAPGAACVEAACVAGKCTTALTAEACDDGDPCTKNDRCLAGACSGIDAGCQCATDNDCGAFEDGNACNGTLYCDNTKAPYHCRVNPGSGVKCDSGKDHACAASVCDPTTGKCATKAAPDGTACDDGDPCPVDSFCKKGTCESSDLTLCECQ